MARCEDCHREMGLAPSCIEAPMIIARGDYIRLRYPLSEAWRCHDCNVKPAAFTMVAATKSSARVAAAS